MENSLFSVKVSTNLALDHMGISLSTINLDYKLGIIVENSLKPIQTTELLTPLLWITQSENFYIRQKA